MVLGWHRWREFEEKYGYGIVERFVHALMDAGYLTSAIWSADPWTAWSGSR